MSKLSEAEYIAIKQLLAKGYKGNKVAEIVERGTATVSDVKNSADFNDYKEKQAKAREQREASKPAEQLTLDVPLDGDKRADIFVALNRVVDLVYDYQADLDDLGILSRMEVKAIEIATQKIEEAKFWLKEYL